MVSELLAGFIAFDILAVLFVVNLYAKKKKMRHIPTPLFTLLSLCVLFVLILSMRLFIPPELPRQDLEKRVFAMPASGVMNNGIRVVRVEMFSFGFDPDPLIINQGERVRLILTSRDVAHGFQISMVLPNSQDNIVPGEERILEFVADLPGIYHMTCSTYCGTDHGEMEGLFVIKPA